MADTIQEYFMIEEGKGMTVWNKSWHYRDQEGIFLLKKDKETIFNDILYLRSAIGK